MTIGTAQAELLLEGHGQRVEVLQLAGGRAYERGEAAVVLDVGQAYPVADADGVGREDGGGNALRLFSPRHMVPVR